MLVQAHPKRMKNFWTMRAAVCPHIKTDAEGSLIFAFSRLLTEGSVHDEEGLGWRERVLRGPDFARQVRLWRKREGKPSGFQKLFRSLQDLTQRISEGSSGFVGGKTRDRECASFIDVVANTSWLPWHIRGANIFPDKERFAFVPGRVFYLDRNITVFFGTGQGLLLYFCVFKVSKMAHKQLLTDHCMQQFLGRLVAGCLSRRRLIH